MYLYANIHTHTYTIIHTDIYTYSYLHTCIEPQPYLHTYSETHVQMSIHTYLLIGESANICIQSHNDLWRHYVEDKVNDNKTDEHT